MKTFYIAPSKSEALAYVENGFRFDGPTTGLLAWRSAVVRSRTQRGSSPFQIFVAKRTN